jgi:CRP-like cAMP-binding protein
MVIGRSAFRKTIAEEPKVALALLASLAQRLRLGERSPAH